LINNNLTPKKIIKLKKSFNPKLLRIKKNSDFLLYGDYGLKSKLNKLITVTQLESLKKTLIKKIKKIGKLWIRVFPHFFITKKPLEVRMGNGKGNFDKWAVNIKKGMVLFEFKIIDKNLILDFPQLIKECSSKLSFPLKIIKKNDIC